MTDHETSPTPAKAATAQPNPPRRARRTLTIAAIALAAGLTGAAATRALSDTTGFGRGHWHGHGMMGQSFDPARAEQRADRAVRHLAIEIDATTEQEEKLRGIVKAAVKDLVPLREKAQAARQRASQLLTLPNIDPAAIETFRAEQMAQLDAASKRLAQALAEAAQVLTPEQRRKISDHPEQRGGPPWRRWHRG